MNSAIRVISRRPLLVAIGPTASALVHRYHPDLELVDLVVAESAPSVDELRWLVVSHLLERSFTVVLFDPHDEMFWPTARVVTRETRIRTPHPVWFVCPDAPRNAPRAAMLERLARDLEVCVVDPGELDVLDVALMGAAGLYRLGVTGADIVDLARVAQAGSVGRATPREMVIDASVERAIVVMRCSPDVTLQAINATSQSLAEMLPNAELFLATPLHPHLSQSPLETFVIGFGSVMANDAQGDCRGRSPRVK